jgi:SAM-dependent methyltransferase
MTPETARALALINERFYRTEARLFASKRERPWQGMRQLFDELPAPPRAVLDVGCGHGRFAALLRERAPAASYCGVDASEELLALARARADLPAAARFERVDVIADAAAIPRGAFDLIGMFGVVHHVPGEARRAALLCALASRLAPGGTLAVAFWRTSADESPDKRVAWERAGIDPRDVESGDRLLRFDTDPDVFRFSHFVDEPELARVAAAVRLPLARRYDSDGAGGIANAYLLWRRA